MQIKSYILVRVTEALRFVSGLRCQIGFLSVLSVHVVLVSGTAASSLHGSELTSLLGLSVGDSLARERSYHFPRAGSCGAVGRFPAAAGAQGPLQVLGGGSSSNK